MFVVGYLLVLQVWIHKLYIWLGLGEENFFIEGALVDRIGSVDKMLELIKS